MATLLAPRRLWEKPLCGNLARRRMYARIRHLAQPARYGGIGRVDAWSQSHLPLGGGKRYPEAAFQIGDEALGLVLRLRPMSRHRPVACVLGVVVNDAMKAMAVGIRYLKPVHVLP